MADEVAELSPLQEPGEITVPEAGSKYESYKADSVYEYALLPNGRRPDKSRAKITYKYGDVYDGSLKKGKFNGAGKYTWQGGDVFEGNFKSGKITGKGKFSATNGDVYEGNFKDNKYDGDGKYTWADGRIFEGTFKNGQVSSGRYIDAHGNVYSCKFTYHRNGERKSSTIRLVRFAENSINGKPAEQKKATTKNKPKTATNKDGLLSKDVKLIAAIKKSKRGAEFKNFYSGAAGKTEKAEKGLIAILNFFSNSDAEQIARIFKSSAIYDKTKGDAHVTDMITGVIKRSRDFTSNMRSAQKPKQKGNSANKGAAK